MLRYTTLKNLIKTNHNFIPYIFSNKNLYNLKFIQVLIIKIKSYNTSDMKKLRLKNEFPLRDGIL